MITVTTRDFLTPDLIAKYKAAGDKVGMHQAIGLGLASLTKRAWTDSSLRPLPWANKSDGSAATLRKSGTLAKSIRTIATARAATIASDRHYAAIHQLGGRTQPHIIRPKNKKALKTPYGLFKKINHPGSNIPARPFMPFTPDGKPTPVALKMINQVLKQKLNIP
jgi:phage gpG-like protein